MTRRGRTSGALTPAPFSKPRGTHHDPPGPARAAARRDVATPRDAGHPRPAPGLDERQCTMNLIRAIHPIEETGPVIRFSPDADLDEVLMEALTIIVDKSDYDGAWLCEEDMPSRVLSYYGPTSREPLIGWFRMDPCACGDHEHNWHIRHLGDERP